MNQVGDGHEQSHRVCLGGDGVTTSAQDTWTSVLSPSPDLSAGDLRRIAEDAGVHIYCDADEAVCASRNLVSLHTATGGRRHIRLPRTCAVVKELFSDRVVATDAREFEDDLAAPSTALYGLDW